MRCPPSVNEAYEARVDTLRAVGRSGRLEARTPQERARCELACASPRAFWRHHAGQRGNVTSEVLLLEKSLRPIDALPQALLKRRILRPSNNVLSDGSTDDFGHRSILDRCNRLQGISLIFR